MTIDEKGSMAPATIENHENMRLERLGMVILCQVTGVTLLLWFATLPTKHLPELGCFRCNLFTSQNL